MNELKRQWYLAFCSTMKLILRQDKEHLEFIFVWRRKEESGNV